jgi:alkanesulfonate monooxygenase SsuD/methylene tetrahydromethanopterin reductase-like flavin-dependent oxidoreductase (luciferase family)
VAPEFSLFLPQMRFTIDALVERALAAEAAGFVGMAGMDHLAPPLALDQPMYEAMTTATWLAARTETLVHGHLVMCDAFRHPAVLARQAVTLDHASGGRFELGLGWGSVTEEFSTYGVTPMEAGARLRRLEETLTIVRALWSGETFDYHGEFFQLEAASQRPTPLDRIPILIGGSGPRTMKLVAEYADWWNLLITKIHELDKLRPQAGNARVSTQQMVAFVPSEGERAKVEDLVARRFPGFGEGLVIGDGRELTDYYAAMHARGVERFYVWFADFAPAQTLAAFGAEVIAEFA